MRFAISYATADSNPLPVFGSLMSHCEPFSVPPWKYGAYAGLSVPTVSFPSVVNVAPAAHCWAVCVALPVAAGDAVVLELEHAAATDASTANPTSILRIAIPFVAERSRERST